MNLRKRKTMFFARITKLNLRKWKIQRTIKLPQIVIYIG